MSTTNTSASPAPSPPSHQTVVVNQPRQSQALPALVNFFIPGLGQLIQGRILAWLVWWIVVPIIVVGLGFATGGIGLIVLIPLAYFGCIIDAARYSPKA